MTDKQLLMKFAALRREINGLEIMLAEAGIEVGVKEIESAVRRVSEEIWVETGRSIR